MSRGALRCGAAFGLLTSPHRSRTDLRTISDRFDLTSRLALVTGASRGIGQALAVGLAEAGADIVATARSESGLTKTADAIAEKGRRCHPIACDLTAAGAVTTLFKTLADRSLSPTILINNAGME
ncbi:MAG: SDR family NAD(P)-dependent oxidoreductase, partial [Pseudomonadota bacterium]